MLLSECVEVKWNGANKRRYVDLGYEYTSMGSIFYVNIDDLSKGSHSIVLIKCDYCGEVINRRYKDYLVKKNNSIINKDCCDDCRTIKSREGFIEKNKVTPEDFMQSDEVRKKARQTIKDRYGVSNPSQIPGVVEKIQHTRDKRYGREYFSKLMSGSNNPMWKGGVKATNELARCSYQYTEWRESVYKQCNFACVCCNIRGGSLEAHHIKGFSEFPELRYDVENGAVLCLECHRAFHSKYGNFGFDKSDLEEFIIDYKKV